MSEESYKKIILIDKKNIIAYYNLKFYKDRDDLINAEKYYKSVIDLKPDMLHAYKIFIYNRSNQFNKLKNILDKLNRILRKIQLLIFKAYMILKIKILKL